MALLLNASDSVNRSYTITKPSPTHPLDVNGVGELEENVAIIDNQSDTITNSYYKDVRLSDELPAGKYTISFTMNSKTGNAYASSLGKGSTTVYQADVSEFLINNTPANINRMITLNSNACIWARFLRSATPATFSYSISGIAIVSGDNPYGQYKIPILSNSTTTPVYLGEVETTRKIKKLVLTGEENWTISAGWKKTTTSVFYTTLANIIHIFADNVVFIYSNAFSAATRNELYNGDSNMIARTGVEALTIRVSDSIATTVTDFKSYLQQQYANGTPVTVWYVLDAPETGIVNEPLMKIGEYADTVSGITIPTITGKYSFDVETTLKPSEASLSYTGWHDAEVKEYVSAGTTIANLESMSISQMENLTIQELQGGNWV